MNRRGFLRGLTVGVAAIAYRPDLLFEPRRVVLAQSIPASLPTPVATKIVGEILINGRGYGIAVGDWWREQSRITDPKDGDVEMILARKGEHLVNEGVVIRYREVRADAILHRFDDGSRFIGLAKSGLGPVPGQHADG